MDRKLLGILVLLAVTLIISTWTCEARKHHRLHLKNLARHKISKHEPGKEMEAKKEDKHEDKTEIEMSGSGAVLLFADDPEEEIKEDEKASDHEEKRKAKHEKTVSPKPSKKRKFHDEDDGDQGSLRDLLDSSIENLAKAGKAIQAILDATGTRKVSQTCPGACPDVCAPGCISTCCTTPSVDPMAQATAAQVQYPNPYQQTPYPYPQQQQYSQMPQYPQMPQAPQVQPIAQAQPVAQAQSVPQAPPISQYTQRPATQQCPQQCSVIPCPSACPQPCCSSQLQYAPQPSQPPAPNFLVLPPAKPKANNTQPTQSPSCTSPCSQSCAPLCQPECCSASMGVPLAMGYQQQQQQQPVMAMMPQLPQMQQQACPQACQPAVPGGCAPQAQCPPKCCQNGRR